MSIAEKFEVIADEVYEKGKKDEYDKFWDNFQEYGNRTSYSRAFQGRGFNNQNLYPKYNICLVGDASYIFYAWSQITNTSLRNINLKERLEECGVVLDTSKATILTSAFAYFYVSELPTIDLTGLTNASSMMFAENYDYLKSIEKIIMVETTPISSNWFRSDTGLENLIVEGTIAQNNFNVKDCKKITVASLLSILTALSKDSSIATGKSITFSTVHKDIIEGDAECLEQYNLAISAGWTIAYA